MILAAGLGTRMRSRNPKVLHPLCGRPMIDYVIEACRDAGARRIVVVLNPAQPEVAEHIHGRCEVAYQAEPLGTGHALLQVPEDVLGGGELVVLYGDSPLVQPETLEALVKERRKAGAAVALATVEDPTRNDGRVILAADGTLDRIVEAKDASPAELAVKEQNVGIYAFAGGSALLQALALIKADNRASEFYLTSVFQHLSPAAVLKIADPAEGMGINDRVQLARADGAMRIRILERLMLAGVTVVDPQTTYVDATVRVGEDPVIEPGTFLRGRTRIGTGCRIGPAADVTDSTIGDNCRVEHSWLKDCTMAAGSDCGPYSKLRPGTEIGLRAHVGTFAEIVRSKIGAGTAVPHFSYLGDATVGEGVNVGAGTITANYDGDKKNPTAVGDGSFVGVDTMFVAPVKMGRRSRTGVGSVVTKDIPDDSLAVGVPARVLQGRGVKGKARGYR